MLTQQVRYDTAPCTDGVVGIFDSEIFTSTAKVSLTRFETGQSLRIAENATKELEDAVDFGMIHRKSLAQDFLLQLNNRLANFCIRKLITWND
jgi:hypothetical protein